MIIKNWMKRLLKLLFKKKSNRNWFLNVGREPQLSILGSFQEPKGCIERSFFQYKCQNHQYSLLILFFLNLASAFYLPFILYRKYSPATAKEFCSKKQAAFLCEGVDKSILPNVLKTEFDEIDCYPYVGEIYLRLSDRDYFTQHVLKCYWGHPYFCLKILMRMGIYSNVINTKRYTAIISHCEYSCASSFLTEYCRTNNIEHINIMHGELLFNITDAFVCFDKFFIWDNHYMKIFDLLRADIAQYVCAIPDAMRFTGQIEENKKIDYTYYLGSEGVQTLANICSSLDCLVERGNHIAIRPHPRYSSMKDICDIFSRYEIENCSEMSIEKSVMRTGCVISFYSTVMIQAQINGVDVVIDDISDPNKFRKLLELEYRFASHNLRRLSEVLKANNY